MISQKQSLIFFLHSFISTHFFRFANFCSCVLPKRANTRTAAEVVYLRSKMKSAFCITLLITDINFTNMGDKFRFSLLTFYQIHEMEFDLMCSQNGT